MVVGAELREYVWEGVCEAVRRYIMHTPGKILEIA